MATSEGFDTLGYTEAHAESVRVSHRPEVAIVHDYLTQRGGAERVVLSMLKAFPQAVIHTSFYRRNTTFPEFADYPLVTLPIARFSLLSRNHRLAFPFLAAAFSGCEVAADVVLCSSSGWAHGVRADGRKVIYCHSPARWLYGDTYLHPRRRLAKAGLGLIRPALIRWDKQAAASADRVLTNSTSVRDRIREVYAIDAEVLPPPHTINVDGPEQKSPGVEPGYFLVVSRLMVYKNVMAVVEAFTDLPNEHLVIVGVGPEAGRLRAACTANVTFLGSVSDAELRWLYRHAQALVAASFEDFGLTPVEAAAYGTPAVALGHGGFLDTVVEGTTGIFFDRPTPSAIRAAVLASQAHQWSPSSLVAQAERFSERRFISRLRDIVAETGRSDATG
jgi:glycosyltransferase involved in cell wall biosynthesis